MSKRPVLEDVIYVVTVHVPDDTGDKLNTMAVCTIGTTQGAPNQLTMLVDCAPGVTPDLINAMIHNVGLSFMASDRAAENKGVPVNPLTGEPIQ
jgi:hypothetical protein